MTAGSGTLHDEFHAREFTHSGGVLEMVQLQIQSEVLPHSACLSAIVMTIVARHRRGPGAG